MGTFPTETPPTPAGALAALGMGPDAGMDADLAAERLERAIDAVPRPAGIGLPYVDGWSVVIPMGGPGFHAEVVMAHRGRPLKIVEPIGGVSLEWHDYIGDVARAALAAGEPRFDPANALDTCR